eukprot:NODE_321_length_996_cov_57.154171_g277_i0.p1 GENE.NODE_321_length_996_cov_57.154171_g277_i0~~NODE_321_length_996_cov_57.154171_g277_i0.p1  ORF type:complete len:311 (+),score=106.01 NODE_321_length_996_cov_57.154171_g277_i0:33-965(+)
MGMEHCLGDGDDVKEILEYFVGGVDGRDIVQAISLQFAPKSNSGGGETSKKSTSGGGEKSKKSTCGGGEKSKYSRQEASPAVVELLSGVVGYVEDKPGVFNRKELEREKKRIKSRIKDLDKSDSSDASDSEPSDSESSIASDSGSSSSADGHLSAKQQKKKKNDKKKAKQQMKKAKQQMKKERKKAVKEAIKKKKCVGVDEAAEKILLKKKEKKELEGELAAVKQKAKDVEEDFQDYLTNMEKHMARVLSECESLLEQQRANESAKVAKGKCDHLLALVAASNQLANTIAAYLGFFEVVRQSEGELMLLQ